MKQHTCNSPDASDPPGLRGIDLAATRLLKRREVEQLLSISCSKIYNMMRAGKFPRPIHIGDGEPSKNSPVRWRLCDIEDWVQDRADASAGHDDPF